MKNFSLNFIFWIAILGAHGLKPVHGLPLSKKPLFSDKTYYAALYEARKKKKNLFVFIRSNICGPCDEMENIILNEPELKEVFSKFFVCLKINCDDDFGTSFCKTHKIPSTPAYLFLNPKDESLIYQDAGFFEKSTMMRLAKAGRNFGALMVEMYAQFETENNLPDDFYEDYTRFLEYRGERALKIKVMRRYIENRTPAQLATPVSWRFLKELCNTTDDRYFDIFYSNLKLFVERFGAMEVKEHAVRIFQMDKERAVVADDDVLFRRALDLYMKVLQITEPDLTEKERKLIENGYKTDYYLRVKNYPQYARYASQCIGDLYANNPRLLYEHALNFVLHVNDREYLEQAVSWAAQSILLSPHYENIAVYAMLLHKTGDSENALKMTYRALEQARQEEVFDKFKIAELQQLLKKMVEPREAVSSPRPQAGKRQTLQKIP